MNDPYYDYRGYSLLSKSIVEGDSMDQTSLFEAVTAHVGEAVEAANKLVAPHLDEGEALIHTFGFTSDTITNALTGTTVFSYQLKNGRGGSCAPEKIKTLINHPGYDRTGTIPMFKIDAAIDDKPYRGAVKLSKCTLPATDDHPALTGDIIVAFSGREDWQDIIYACAIIKELQKHMEITIPDDVLDDPDWGTQLNMIFPWTCEETQGEN
jgi:hypothetical protein